jgi:SM-20-related protein
MALRCLDLEAFAATPLSRDPFAYLIVPGFIRAQVRPGIHADYPQISERGSFPLTQLRFGERFSELIDELNSDAFRHAFEAKFAINLTGRPSTITVRGQCGPKDGKIHTDSLSKIITVLIYLNPSWETAGGRLRLLRADDDLSSVIAEVPPTEGTLLAFKRADNSWHGHQPFVGERRVIQFNWVTSKGNRRIAMLRHHLSAPFKRIVFWLRPYRSPPRSSAPSPGS